MYYLHSKILYSLYHISSVRLTKNLIPWRSLVPRAILNIKPYSSWSLCFMSISFWILMMTLWCHCLLLINVGIYFVLPYHFINLIKFNIDVKFHKFDESLLRWDIFIFTGIIIARGTRLLSFNMGIFRFPDLELCNWVTFCFLSLNFLGFWKSLYW